MYKYLFSYTHLFVYLCIYVFIYLAYISDRIYLFYFCYDVLYINILVLCDVYHYIEDELNYLTLYLCTQYLYESMLHIM